MKTTESNDMNTKLFKKKNKITVTTFKAAYVLFPFTDVPAEARFLKLIILAE